MWCDTFDGDLYKLVPDAKRLLEGSPIRGIELKTEQTRVWPEGVDPAKSELNHPCAWNGGSGFVAFFGFEGTGRPSSYVTGAREPLIVTCTLEDALRDAWVHTLDVVVEGGVVWQAGRLSPMFMDLLHAARSKGARGPLWKRPELLARHRTMVVQSLRMALLDAAVAAQTHGRMPPPMRSPADAIPADDLREPAP